MNNRLNDYFSTLNSSLNEVKVTDNKGVSLNKENAVDWFLNHTAQLTENGNKLIFVGNGGSAAIASHMAIDFSKNGNIPALSFNDGASLTCLANDLGYEQVFAKQIELHAHKNDLLVAISSSGSSLNILNAVTAARNHGCNVLTLSGFNSDNPLRQMGDMNLYVSSREYGFVEVAHLGLCHALLDIAMGWQGVINKNTVERLNVVGI